MRARAASLDADQFHGGVIREGVEDADGVAAAADAGHYQVGQASLLRQNLLARLAADDGLEVAHDAWVGMRSDDRADQVEGGLDVRHPVANGLVDGVFERATA